EESHRANRACQDHGQELENPGAKGSRLPPLQSQVLDSERQAQQSALYLGQPREERQQRRKGPSALPPKPERAYRQRQEKRLREGRIKKERGGEQCQVDHTALCDVLA